MNDNRNFRKIDSGKILKREREEIQIDLESRLSRVTLPVGEASRLTPPP